MEIWDVTVNTLEPFIQFKLPKLGLRRVNFYNYTQVDTRQEPTFICL